MCVYCEYCNYSRVLLTLLEKWRRGQEIIVQVDGCVVYSFSFVKFVVACFLGLYHRILIYKREPMLWLIFTPLLLNWDKSSDN